MIDCQSNSVLYRIITVFLPVGIYLGGSLGLWFVLDLFKPQTIHSMEVLVGTSSLTFIVLVIAGFTTLYFTRSQRGDILAELEARKSS